MSTTTEQMTADNAAKAAPAAATPDPLQTEKDTIENLRREYFAPAELAKANEELAKVVHAASMLKLAVRYNFDPNAEFPAGYGIAVIPNQQQVKGQGNVVTGVAIAAIPDPATIGAHEGGTDFIQNVVVNACMAKVANAVRVRADGSVASSVPYSIADFITSMRGAEGTLATYNALAPDMVKALRQKGLKHITSGILREVLQSSAFAAEQFTKIDQAKWVMVLDAMIVRAKAKNLDSAVLENWKSTRDSAEIAVDTLDISDMADLVAAPAPAAAA